MMRTLLAATTFCVISSAALGAADIDAGKADAALNANYKALLSQLDDGNQQRLRDAQRAWIAFRDKECSFRTQGGSGGSASALASSACLAELSQQRADALQRQLDCPEGDVTCVPRNRSAVVSSTAEVPCSQTAGKQKADEYVQQCLQVSPATHPPCIADNPCELITSEIERGCSMIDKNAPAFCANYTAGKR